MTNYSRGRYYEYKAKKELEAQGYTILRSAGSHGPWDLTAFKDEEPVRCVQIKYTKSERGMKRLLNTFKPILVRGQSHYQTELWVWFKGKWHISNNQPVAS